MKKRDAVPSGPQKASMKVEAFAFLKHFVYILQSETDGTHYKGYSTDYLRRLGEHNEGHSRYTSSKRPWKLVYVEVRESKKDALIRERQLKRANMKYISWLLDQPTNILK